MKQRISSIHCNSERKSFWFQNRVSETQWSGELLDLGGFSGFDLVQIQDVFQWQMLDREWHAVGGIPEGLS
jgi:hypothetical protein